MWINGNQDNPNPISKKIRPSWEIEAYASEVFTSLAARATIVP